MRGKAGALGQDPKGDKRGKYKAQRTAQGVKQRSPAT